MGFNAIDLREEDENHSTLEGPGKFPQRSRENFDQRRREGKDLRWEE